MNLNISPSPFAIEQQINEDYDQNHFSCQVFYNSAQDHTVGYYHHQLYQPQYNQEDETYCYEGGSLYDINNKVEMGLKLTVWNKEDGTLQNATETNNLVKWVPSKMRLTKKPDRLNKSSVNKIEDQKLQLSTNNSHNINNSPIRVCSDCNTTKTPLWRSGPKGPKSLCNACGIRQRKARRSAAAANSMAVVTDQPPSMKIKVQHKEKISKNGHASKFKKRCKMTAGSSSNGQKKLDFEEFLINLSKNLAFQRVFPEDEKDAAILLMALSYGLVHG